MAELTLAVPDVGVNAFTYHLHFLEHRGGVSLTPASSADTASTWRYSSDLIRDRQVVSILLATESLDGVDG